MKKSKDEPKPDAAIWSSPEYDRLLLVRNRYTELYINEKIWLSLSTIDNWVEIANEDRPDIIHIESIHPDYGQLVAYHITGRLQGRWIRREPIFSELNNRYKSLYCALKNEDEDDEWDDDLEDEDCGCLELIPVAIYRNDAYTLLIDRGGYTDIIKLDDKLRHDTLTIKQWLDDPDQASKYPGYQRGSKIKDVTTAAEYGEIVSCYDRQWYEGASIMDHKKELEEDEA